MTTNAERDVSANTQTLIDLLRKRDALGLAKYGVSLDRTDLSATDWIQHAVEELLDGAAYLTGLKRTLATPAATSDVLPQEPAGRELPDERRLYLDCDGVLADFDAAFVAKFGHSPRDYESTHGSEVFWRDIAKEAPTFYRDLPLMPDARELFDAVKHLRPIILTGCPQGGWAEMQKLAWAAEHFPGTPMVVCRARDKSLYLQPGDVLIDDRTQYRDKWEAAGGVFIHHTSAAESLRLLKGHGGWRRADAGDAEELAALRAAAAWIREHHNGFDPAAREAMDMAKPRTLVEALEQLEAEHEWLLNDAIEKLATAQAELAAIYAKYPSLQSAVTDSTPAPPGGKRGG